ncbi:glycosyltransferase family 87 protein [Corynebacterium lowii]|uniref:DUF2029 domain-containing protein n=1 Tax=Corynebacterium lowii TaxID=1544413 RepID=A0A0Q0U4V3_9CORY|nr:glycosyltransferase 87 family protein [Corynebacterium lowii]KQB86969.1 hypothetical protein Clow_00014 [Corynebacterium lowii]MDP9852451.1 putative membrane protein [Corynebacterium lowii]
MTLLSLGYLSKAHCLASSRGDDGILRLDWSGNRQYMSACYSDIAGFHSALHFEELANPFAARTVEEPVLTSLFQWLINALSHLTYPAIEALSLPIAPAAWYFTISAAVLGCTWIITLRLLMDVVGNRVWDLILVAGSPLLIVYAFHAWDLLAVFALVAALRSVRYQRPVAAGIWIGVGAAFQVWPGLLVVALFLLGARTRQWAFPARVAVASAATWILLNAPVLLLYPQAWLDPYRSYLAQGASWDTLYYLVGQVLGVPFSPTALNVMVPGLWIVGLLLIAQWGLAARRTPRLAEVLFLLVAFTLLLSKQWLPQHALWLLVPAVLALPRWRLLLSWMFLELLVFPATMLYSGAEEGNGLPLWFFATLIVLRGGVLTALVVMVSQQLRGQREDKVDHATGGVDPALPWGKR